MPPPLAAFDVDSIIGLVFVVFWVLAWLFKLATGQTQKGPPVPSRPRPPVRPRDEKLQEEIDIFIQEVGPKNGVRRPQPKSARPPAPVKAPAPAKKTRPISDKKPSSQRPAPRRIRPGEEISTRHMPSADQSLGAGIKQHLAQHMAERVAQETAAHLKPQVGQSVTEHLGRSAAAAGLPQTTGTSAAGARPATHGGGFAELFKDPTSLRQAMVISLILSPPPGRSPRSAQ